MRAFSIVAALATAVQALALIMLHLLPTGYHPVRDAVSDYGIGPYRGWFWLQTAAGGVGCLALGIAPGPAASVYPDPGGRGADRDRRGAVPHPVLRAL
jgi:hypothetical protein